MQHWASLGQRRRPSDGTLNGNKTYAHSFFPWKHCVGLKACAESERERERERQRRRVRNGKKGCVLEQKKSASSVGGSATLGNRRADDPDQEIQIQHATCG